MKLEQLSVREFIKVLGSGNPAPGGGSAAALCGALGAALAAMVSRLTLGKEKYRDAWQNMASVQQTGDHMAEQFLALVQKDTDAYQGVITAIRLPKETEEEKASRQKAMQKAMKRAAKVPLESLRTAEKLILIAKEVVERGNPNTFTDAGAAVQLARTASTVAAYNVLINLSGIRDEGFASACKEEVKEILGRIDGLFKEAERYVNSQLP